MSEYFRERNNRIQAGFALRTGKLLAQYRYLTGSLLPTEKYEATLAICAFQALLTNCYELICAMKHHQREFWSSSIPDIGIGHLGMRRSFVAMNTFPDALTYSEFVEHLRNALSHPTSPDRRPQHPTTGYTTTPDGSGVITQFRFTDSPWIDRGAIHSKALSNNEAIVKRTLESFQRNRAKAAHLDVRNKLGKYQICDGDTLYLPVFIAELPLSALTDLAIELANHLSQPVDEKWDGRTIQRLVA